MRALTVTTCILIICSIALSNPVTVFHISNDIHLNNSGFDSSNLYEPAFGSTNERTEISSNGNPSSNADDYPVLSAEMIRTLEQSSSETFRVIIELIGTPSAEHMNSIKQQSMNKVRHMLEDTKVDDFILQKANLETARMRERVHQYLVSYLSDVHTTITNLITSVDGIVLHHLYFANAIAAQLNSDAIFQLAQHSDIRRIIPDAVRTPQLESSNPTIHTSSWTSQGYNGSSVDVAVLDTGVDSSHPALIGRVIEAKYFGVNVTDTDDLDGHGTHVAGIIASTDSTYQGIAPSVNIINVKIGNHNSTNADIMAGAEWAITGTVSSADIINLSFDCDYYLAEFIDSIVYTYNVVWVGAAGNDGPDPYSVQPVGYNMITVGSMNDSDTSDRSDDVISYFSGRGPHWDGAFKPDIVAPGGNITSAAYDWEGSSLDWVQMSGTSMATPHITGAVALLYDYRATDTKYYKALLMGTAEDLGAQGPDDTYGWGYLDLDEAYTQRNNVLLEEIWWDESLSYGVELVEGESFKATMVFERYGSFYEENLTNYYDGYWDLDDISDLNLTLYAPDGTILDESNSSVDNVEQIHLESAPLDGVYLLEISVYSMDYLYDLFALVSNANLTRLHTPVIHEVLVDNQIIAEFQTIPSDRYGSHMIILSIDEQDISPSNLNVSMFVYDPDWNPKLVQQLLYHSENDYWYTFWSFSKYSSIGDWHVILNVENMHFFFSDDYWFQLSCENENPVVNWVTLSSSTIQRDNETLVVKTSVRDYHDSTDVSVFFHVVKNDSFEESYTMSRVGDVFCLNLTLPSDAPLGFWSSEIRVHDQEEGFTSFKAGSFEVLNRRYYLTVISPYGDTNGSAWYDGGSAITVSLDIGSIPLNEGSRRAFVSWRCGDVDYGSNHSQSDAIIIYSNLTITAEWEIQFNLTILSDYGEPRNGGWHSEGTFANAALSSGIIDIVPRRERVVFVRWDGDANGTDRRGSSFVLMNQPRTISIVWQKQFTLKIDCEPNEIVLENIPTLDDWYNESEEVTLQIPVMEGYILDHILIDELRYSVNNATLTIIMNEAHDIVIVYVNVYLLLVLFVGLPLSILVVFLFIERKYKLSSWIISRFRLWRLSVSSES